MILLLSPSDIQDLISIGCLHPQEKETTANEFDSYANLNRASSWICTRDVGIISAWRKEKGNGEPFLRSEKDSRNKDLADALRGLGYGVTKVRGAFPEGGDALVHENSFFVVNHLSTREEFFNDLYRLSELYDQDSFLFKSSDSDTAFYFATNDNTRESPEYPEGKKRAGKIHFDTSNNDGFTEIGAGELCFKDE